MPHAGIHGWMLTNWKPPSLLSKATSVQIVSPAVDHAGEQGGDLDQLGPAVGQQDDHERADRRDGDHRGEERERHQRIPRTTTNQASTSTAPQPMAAA